VAPQAEHVTFDDLCDLLRRDYARRQNRSCIEQRLAHPLRVFAGRRALSITAEEIERLFDARLAAGASVATANRDAAALRPMFRLGVKKKLLPKGSEPDIELRPEDNVRQGFLEAGDLDAFLDALRQRDPVVADITEMAFLTLMRRQNTLRLTWPQFELTIEQGHVTGGELRLPGTQTKNRQPLAMPLTGRLLALIGRRWQARVEACPFVFHRAGQRVVEFRSAWREATEAIGMSGLIVHDLRRSGARALIRTGVPEDVVMRMGGWRTRSMLARYNIVDTTDLADAQAKMDAVLAAPGPRKVVALRRPGS
jgi:integrase